MFSIDDVNVILDEIADEFPTELFNGLNGGVSLLDETRFSEADPNGGLYTLGEYRYDQMGRYIVLYYGSILAVHGRDPLSVFKRNLKKLLSHELTHHIESLAGERGLEIEDARKLGEFLRLSEEK